MARILITSGPTRQYLDPVRFISNASSGRLGSHIAAAAIAAGHEAVVVTGPVSIDYPEKARVIPVTTTQQMLDACQREFGNCQGLIGVAAPCDYQPATVAEQKLKKTGQPLVLQLVQTPDIVASLGASRSPDQWIVGFALETEDMIHRAVTKLHRKCCDLVVLNGPQAMNAETHAVEMIDVSGNVVADFCGPKPAVARAIFLEIQKRLIDVRLAISGDGI